jgi:hypothetical protein
MEAYIYMEKGDVLVVLKYIETVSTLRYHHMYRRTEQNKENGHDYLVQIIFPRLAYINGQQEKEKPSPERKTPCPFQRKKRNREPRKYETKTTVKCPNSAPTQMYFPQRTYHQHLATRQKEHNGGSVLRGGRGLGT